MFSGHENLDKYDVHQGMGRMQINTKTGSVLLDLSTSDVANRNMINLRVSLSCRQRMSRTKSLVTGDCVRQK